MLPKDWSKYDTGHVVFEPKHMTPEELQTGYESYQRHNSFKSIWLNDLSTHYQCLFLSGLPLQKGKLAGYFHQAQSHQCCLGSTVELNRSPCAI